MTCLFVATGNFRLNGQGRRTRTLSHCHCLWTVDWFACFVHFSSKKWSKRTTKRKVNTFHPFCFLFWKEKKSYGTWVCELYKKDTHIVLFRWRKKGYVWYCLSNGYIQSETILKRNCCFRNAIDIVNPCLNHLQLIKCCLLSAGR